MNISSLEWMRDKSTSVINKIALLALFSIPSFERKLLTLYGLQPIVFDTSCIAQGAASDDASTNFH
jgi:hypothetical protein